MEQADLTRTMVPACRLRRKEEGSTERRGGCPSSSCFETIQFNISLYVSGFSPELRVNSCKLMSLYVGFSGDAQVSSCLLFYLNCQTSS